MNKKVLKATAVLCIAAGLLTGGISATAREMKMYVNGHFVTREVRQVDGFDMLPILDIAGELGFEAYTMNDATARVYNDSDEYYFELWNASVINNTGKYIGLDIVPQYMGGRFMVPAKFFQDAFGYSYVWDAKTDTIFLNSENEYNWLINTEEYKNGYSGASASSSNMPTPDDRAEMRSVYTSRLDSIDRCMNNTAATAYTQYDINNAVYNAYEEANAVLNDVYNYLKTIMSSSEFAELQKDEIAWIKWKEAVVAKAGSEFAGGSLEIMEKYSAAYNETVLRCRYLISLI